MAKLSVSSATSAGQTSQLPTDGPRPFISLPSESSWTRKICKHSVRNYTFWTSERSVEREWLKREIAADSEVHGRSPLSRGMKAAFREVFLAGRTGVKFLVPCSQKSNFEGERLTALGAWSRNNRLKLSRCERDDRARGCHVPSPVPSRPFKQASSRARKRVPRPHQRGISASIFAEVVKQAVLSRLSEPSSIPQSPCCIQEQSRLRVDDRLRSVREVIPECDKSHIKEKRPERRGQGQELKGLIVLIRRVTGQSESARGVLARDIRGRRACV